MDDRWYVYSNPLVSERLTVYHLMHLSIRQPVNPRTRQQPQQEASPQEPEEPEEILGSDDEEQEDPHDYCKGELQCYFCILLCRKKPKIQTKKHTCSSFSSFLSSVFSQLFWILGYDIFIS